MQLGQNLVAIASGLLFGLGLGLSQMVDRERVLSFLNVTGRWDPALLFVLGGAVTVTAIAFRFVLQMPQPVFATKFRLPTRKDIDRSLILGAAIFGIGWGIAGYCPGPAIVALTLTSWSPILFLVAFVIGSLSAKSIIHDRF
ncbi:MAG: DUF6691 family protein [Leptolyngbyaceae cyanobacterium]